MCPFVLQGEESTVLLDGNSEVGLMGSKVVRVSSVSGSLTIWAKCKRKKKRSRNTANQWGSYAKHDQLLAVFILIDI